MHVVDGVINEFEIYSADNKPVPKEFSLDELRVIKSVPGNWTKEEL